MQLDRFTEKAQEAIVNAQELAQRLDSPVLDAEHLLSALIEPDDGVPAETLRRLGVDLPAFRAELAGLLAKRARIQGGQITLDPRAKRVIDRAPSAELRPGQVDQETLPPYEVVDAVVERFMDRSLRSSTRFRACANASSRAHKALARRGSCAGCRSGRSRRR